MPPSYGTLEGWVSFLKEDQLCYCVKGPFLAALAPSAPRTLSSISKDPMAFLFKCNRKTFSKRKSSRAVKKGYFTMAKHPWQPHPLPSSPHPVFWRWQMSKSPQGQDSGSRAFCTFPTSWLCGPPLPIVPTMSEVTIKFIFWAAGHLYGAKIVKGHSKNSELKGSN